MSKCEHKSDPKEYHLHCYICQVKELEQKVNHWKHIAEINRLECETMHSEKEELENFAHWLTKGWSASLEDCLIEFRKEGAET